MSGGSFVGLILLSMAWLFFALGAVTNFSVLRRAMNAKQGERAPSGVPFLPGVVGSLAAFFTLPALAARGLELPWPWLWILLPLLLDVHCIGGVVLFLFSTRTKRDGAG
jgi:hypothetical protein